MAIRLIHRLDPRRGGHGVPGGTDAGQVPEGVPPFAEEVLEEEHPVVADLAVIEDEFRQRMACAFGAEDALDGKECIPCKVVSGSNETFRNGIFCSTFDLRTRDSPRA